MRSALEGAPLATYGSSVLGLRTILLGLAVALAAAPVAAAETYRVTRTGDPAPGACLPSDCSLREAVLAANASVGVADTIVLPGRGPYNLTRFGEEDGAMLGDLDVTNDALRVVHPGKGRAVIDAGGIDRVFHVFAGAPLTLEKLVVRDGNAVGAQGYGGGIRAAARLRIIRTHVLSNLAAQCGGGIHTQDGAALVLDRARVAGNRAVSDGGGISASCFGNGGRLTMTRSTVSGNVSDSDNNDIGRGGGIYLQTNAAVQSTITTSTWSGNRAGDEGGAIYTDLGKLRITRTTINGNRAGDLGGGIEVDGTEPLVVVNSTITGNRSAANGGGISLDSGEVSLNGVTVVRNRGNADGVLSEAGGGLYVDTGEVFRVANSLVALNTLAPLVAGQPPVKNDCAGEVDSGGGNLITSRFLCDGFDAVRDRRARNPRLGKLRATGGPTRTVALLARSPAINGARASAPSRDQRGVRRVKPDSGAFERR